MHVPVGSGRVRGGVGCWHGLGALNCPRTLHAGVRCVTHEPLGCFLAADSCTSCPPYHSDPTAVENPFFEVPLSSPLCLLFWPPHPAHPNPNPRRILTSCLYSSIQGTWGSCNSSRPCNSKQAPTLCPARPNLPLTWVSNHSCMPSVHSRKMHACMQTPRATCIPSRRC